MVRRRVSYRNVPRALLPPSRSLLQRSYARLDSRLHVPFTTTDVCRAVGSCSSCSGLPGCGWCGEGFASGACVAGSVFESYSSAWPANTACSFGLTFAWWTGGSCPCELPLTASCPGLANERYLLCCSLSFVLFLKKAACCCSSERCVCAGSHSPAASATGTSNQGSGSGPAGSIFRNIDCSSSSCHDVVAPAVIILGGSRRPLFCPRPVGVCVCVCACVCVCVCMCRLCSCCSLESPRVTLLHSEATHAQVTLAICTVLVFLPKIQQRRNTSE
jgi:hypothetical protein